VYRIHHLYISQRFSSSATFYSRPFQSLRTLDALSRCNISGIARSSASASIFAPFCPFNDTRHVQRNLPSSPPSTLQPDGSYAFSLSPSRERIVYRYLRVMFNKICRLRHKNYGAYSFSTLFRYKIAFLFDLCGIPYSFI